MQNVKFIGILLNGGTLDKYMMKVMSTYLVVTADRLRGFGRPVNHSSLARELGTHRGRIKKLVEALEITSILD